MERDWEREGEAKGCKIVCMHVRACVDTGENKG